MSVVTAKDATSAVIGLLGTAPTCGSCFMGCASKQGAEKTACGMACGEAPEPPAPPAPCTQEQLMSVVTAKDATSAVIGLLGTAPTCGSRFMGCASKQGAEKTACGMACGEAPSAGAPKCKDLAPATVKSLSGPLGLIA